MALPKLFQRIFWHNNTTPAINEDNLNAMSKAIDDIDDRVIELGADVLEKVPEIEEMMDDVTQLSKNPPYIGQNGNWYVWNIEQGDYVDSGIDASITLTIQDITMLAYDATPYVTNTGTNTDSVFHLYIPKAASISNVEKTSTSGLVDTYTITMEDGTTKTFNVTNGAKGDTGTTPSISATATADSTSSASPTVQVTKSGTDAAPSFAFAFSGLKGVKGDKGDKGDAGTTEWSGINDKPFNSVGNGLSVSNNVLQADVKSVSIANFGTASASNVNYQKITVNGSAVGDAIRGTMYMEQSITLSTSNEVTATFTNSAITANSSVEVETTDPNLTYKTMNISNGSCTVTFDKQSSASTITVRIWIK